MLSYKISISMSSFIYTTHGSIFNHNHWISFQSHFIFRQTHKVCPYQRLTPDPKITSESNRKDQGKFKHPRSSVYSGTRCVWTPSRLLTTWYLSLHDLDHQWSQRIFVKHRLFILNVPSNNNSYIIPNVWHQFHTIFIIQYHSKSDPQQSKVYLT